MLYLKRTNQFSYYSINEAAKKFGCDTYKLPISIKILLENVIRNFSNKEEYIKDLLNWQKNSNEKEIQFKPSRVLMQDFTGVPALVDLASMRDAVHLRDGDSTKVNPKVPVDLIIDHSIQVDDFGSDKSIIHNMNLEMQRNMERYEFLKWSQDAFTNLRIIPPGKGICHQVNIEFLSKVIAKNKDNNEIIAYPDTLVGTDSHTTMVNCLCVLGWGVGGIEAESVMLGRSISMLIPEVIGVRLVNKLREGVTATDLVLNITKLLREKKVVQKFVEFYGPGLQNLSLEDRGTISNMAPECGSTVSIFPIDEQTIKYLHNTGRSEEQIRFVEEYAKIQGLWSQNKYIKFSDSIEIDLSSINPTVAGPKRPQDMLLLKNVPYTISEKIDSKREKHTDKLHDGSVVIAAITSCTNTSNPSVMISAGLLAKNAINKGLKVKKWTKTSFAPGSQIVTQYLINANLKQYLDQLGFNLVGYGCTTCIGNSGPLHHEAEEEASNFKFASVLSGNRNFEGRVHPHVKFNYLASPPLVVAYAIAGSVTIDIEKEPLGIGYNDSPIYLKDIWPSDEEIQNIVNNSLNRNLFIERYAKISEGGKEWESLGSKNTKTTYQWKENSSYIVKAPYFDIIQKNKIKQGSKFSINNSRILCVFGDSITTDHISPAGAINKNSPAAIYLSESNIEHQNFNSYGSRRGNHEVMVRGTFANTRIKNLMTNGKEGGYTMHQPSGEEMFIFDAAMKYKETNTDLIVIGGKDYGMGSSRDWAAKGTMLLGVKAVIAESFERIHKSNLIGMGVLPLKFESSRMNFKGNEVLSIIIPSLEPNADADCKVLFPDETCLSIKLKCCIDTFNELEYFSKGGILNSVMNDFL